MATTEQLLRCADCASAMARAEEVQHPTAKCRFLDFYQCQNPACQRRLVLQWERPDGVLTDEDRSWVDQEVARRGVFWPSDYT